MGNCLRQHQSSSTEWENLPAAEEGGSSTTVARTEVKIKITKKQLEELLGKVDVKELRVEQVLAHLMEHSCQYHSLHRPWKPALHSIPEF
ncbi:hypothetical protein SESBI_38187 [Sesbania bispinosa]|nr:hypothetical protein SESBI_38187 [Sesbania bispinosa]